MTTIKEDIGRPTIGPPEDTLARRQNSDTHINVLSNNQNYLALEAESTRGEKRRGSSGGERLNIRKVSMLGPGCTRMNTPTPSVGATKCPS